MTLTKEERIRRARVFKEGKEQEFWLLLKEEMMKVAVMKINESAKLCSKGKFEEARNSALYADVLDMVINAPDEILKAHEGIVKRMIDFVRQGDRNG
jgi:hypothetical protein